MASVTAVRSGAGAPTRPRGLARTSRRSAARRLRATALAHLPEAAPRRELRASPFFAWGVGVALALGVGVGVGAFSPAAAADDYFMGAAPLDVPGAVSPSAGTRVSKLDAAGLYGSSQAGREVERATRASLRETGVVDAASAPQFIRLLFHDAGTFDAARGDGGADGSIRFQAELERPENRRLRVPVKALAKWRAEHGGAVQLSWADLVAVAGAEAVEACGGPRVEVGVGRRDAAGADPEGRMPRETLDGVAMAEAFGAKGLGVREMVALAGAHTVGGKGFGDPRTFDNAYYVQLLATPWEGGETLKANPDPKIAALAPDMAKMIGLPSDRLLTRSDEAAQYVREYAQDEQAFRRDFAAAAAKLSLLGWTR